MFTVTIATDNAAFHLNGAYRPAEELVAILTRLIDTINYLDTALDDPITPTQIGSLYDTLGNCVGEWQHTVVTP